MSGVVDATSQSRLLRSKCAAAFMLLCFCQLDAGNEEALRQALKMEGARIPESAGPGA